MQGCVRGEDQKHRRTWSVGSLIWLIVSSHYVFATKCKICIKRHSQVWRLTAFLPSRACYCFLVGRAMPSKFLHWGEVGARQCWSGQLPRRHAVSIHFHCPKEARPDATWKGRPQRRQRSGKACRMSGARWMYRRAVFVWSKSSGRDQWKNSYVLTMLQLSKFFRKMAYYQNGVTASALDVKKESSVAFAWSLVTHSPNTAARPRAAMPTSIHITCTHCSQMGPV